MAIQPLHRPPQVSYHAAHAAIAAGLEECARIGMLERGGDLEQGERIFGQKVPMQRMRAGLAARATARLAILGRAA